MDVPAVTNSNIGRQNSGRGGCRIRLVDQFVISRSMHLDPLPDYLRLLVRAEAPVIEIHMSKIGYVGRNHPLDII